MKKNKYVTPRSVVYELGSYQSILAGSEEKLTGGSGDGGGTARAKGFLYDNDDFENE